MNNQILEIVTIAQVVQTAVAPVFLITGVGAILGVLSSRLNVIVDRARILETRLASMESASVEHRRLSHELRVLWRRTTLINWSFSSCTISALFVSVVVVLLFMSHIAAMGMANAISILFIIAMMCLIFGLLLLLREVFIATGALRQGMQQVGADLTADR